MKHLIKSNKGVNMNQRQMVKKAFTMIELIFVIVLIGVMMAIFIPKINSNASKGELSNTLGSDIKTILAKASEWKRTDSDSDGTFRNITTAKLETYLPSNMKYDATTDCIASSGYNGQICYKILSDKITNDGDSLKVYIDISKAVSSSEDRKNGESLGENILVKYSSEKDKAVKKSDATDIGNPNDDFTLGGTVDDGKFGVRQITQ